MQHIDKLYVFVTVTKATQFMNLLHKLLFNHYITALYPPSLELTHKLDYRTYFGIIDCLLSIKYRHVCRTSFLLEFKTHIAETSLFTCSQVEVKQLDQNSENITKTLCLSHSLNQFFTGTITRRFLILFILQLKFVSNRSVIEILIIYQNHI